MNAISTANGQATTHYSVYEHAWIHAEQLVKRLVSTIKNQTADSKIFHGAFGCLQTLPLTSEEFASANRRLHNAQSYCDSNEYGAALFEVTLLYRSIRGETECQTNQRKVKLRF